MLSPGMIMASIGPMRAIPAATRSVPSPMSPATTMRRVPLFAASDSSGGPCAFAAAATKSATTMPRTNMPLVKIHLRRGKSAEYLRSVADAVHEALVAQANVPADDRFQIVCEYADEAIIAHPSYAGVDRSRDLIIIEITFNAGRTLDIKKNLYADVTARLGRAADVRPDDILINLVEVTKENWSFGKGIATH